jgi:hypothetical protein
MKSKICFLSVQEENRRLCRQGPGGTTPTLDPEGSTSNQSGEVEYGHSRSLQLQVFETVLL